MIRKRELSSQEVVILLGVEVAALAVALAISLSGTPVKAQGDVNSFMSRQELPAEAVNIRTLYQRAKLACLDGAGATSFWITVDPASGAMNYSCSFNPNRY